MICISGPTLQVLGNVEIYNYWKSILHTFCVRKHYQHTLESGIDVGQGINVGPGKFEKKNK